MVTTTLQALARLAPHRAGDAGPPVVATDAAAILAQRLRQSFPGAERFRVRVSDRLLADAVVGS